MSLNLDIDVGSYVGNSSTNAVTIGWQPAFIVILSTRSSGSGSGRGVTFKTKEMSTSFAMVCSTASVFASPTVAITSTGFTLSNYDAVNDSGITFWYVAFRDRFANDSSNYFGTGDTIIQTTNRAPSAALVFKSSGTERTFFKPLSLGSTWAFYFESAVTSALGNMTLSVNSWWSYSGTSEDGEHYYWASLYNQDASTQHVESGYYNGDGSPGSVTLGYQPKFVFIFNTAVCAFKALGMATDYAGVLETGYNYSSTLVQIDSDGFSYDGDVATSGQGYYWIAGRY
jgi:hypothetical protein